MHGRRGARVALGVVGVAVLFCVVVQIVGPGVAERRVRDRLARHGQVLSVQVSAFPAVELLFGHADSVTAHLAAVQTATTGAGGLLAQTGEAGTVDVTVDRLTVGPLTVDGAHLHKAGDGGLTATAHLTPQELAAALPPGFQVAPVASGNGQLLVRGSVSALGLSASADAVVQAADGRLVLVPAVPFGGLVTLTVFDDPRVSVDGVSASSDPAGYGLSATAHLR